MIRASHASLPYPEIMKWSKAPIKDKAFYRLLKQVPQKVLLWQRFRGSMFPAVWWCVCLIMSYSLQPCCLQPTMLLCPWNLPGKNTGVGSPTLGNLPDLGIESVFPTSPALAGRFFTTEPPGKAWENPNFWLADAEGIMGHASVWCVLSKVISQ